MTRLSKALALRAKGETQLSDGEQEILALHDRLEISNAMHKSLQEKLRIATEALEKIVDIGEPSTPDEETAAEALAALRGKGKK